jgi:lysophospholipase L1-like esterase
MFSRYAEQLALWLLLPVSALQGLRLRRTAPRLPEASGDRSGFCGHGREFRLLAVGDSIIAGVGLATSLDALPVQLARSIADRRQRCVHWRLLAKNGAAIDDVRRMVKQSEDGFTADLILISVGVNDVTGLTSLARWRERCENLLHELRALWPAALVIWAGLPPMERFPLPPQPLRLSLGIRARSLDRIIATLVSKHANVLHIPTRIDPQGRGFCADGFHPNAESCEIWASELALKLEADKLLG